MITPLLKTKWAMGAMGLGIAWLGLIVIQMCVQAGKAAPEELRDTITIKDPQRKKEALLNVVASYLVMVREALPADPAAIANCEAAWRIAVDDYGAARSRPFAVAAWVQEAVRQTGIWVLALNMRRETSRVEVVCLTPQGKILRIVCQWPMTVKYPDLMEALAMPVEFLPLEQIIAEAAPDSEGSLLFVVAPGPKPKMTLPKGQPIAVAVRDRNGEVSNFVPVVDLRRPEPKP